MDDHLTAVLAKLSPRRYFHGLKECRPINISCGIRLSLSNFLFLFPNDRTRNHRSVKFSLRLLILILGPDRKAGMKSSVVGRWPHITLNLAAPSSCILPSNIPTESHSTLQSQTFLQEAQTMGKVS